MTSSHVVADNLAAAGKLLHEAKDAGAEVACLPENFAFIGLRDVDKRAIAEVDGDGPVQQFLSDTARKLKLSMDKVIVTVDQHGNTSAASIPLALDTAVRSGQIRPGQTLMLEGVGGGFTWGSVLLTL